jgi:hypothetical protein
MLSIDPYYEEIQKFAREVPSVTFSVSSKDADVYVDKANCGMFETEVTIATPAGKLQLSSTLVGQHNLPNILAAVAAGLALDVDAGGFGIPLKAPPPFSCPAASPPRRKTLKNLAPPSVHFPPPSCSTASISRMEIVSLLIELWHAISRQPFPPALKHLPRVGNRFSPFRAVAISLNIYPTLPAPPAASPSYDQGQEPSNSPLLNVQVSC